MKYKIVIKGKDIEPLFVDNPVDIQQQWLEGSLPARMMLNGTAFYATDIKSITKVETEPVETLEQAHLNEEREYKEFRRKMLTLSIEERASILRIPNMLWRAFGNGIMPDEVKKEIKERQHEYFVEHPKCIFANPKVYRYIIPMRLDNPRKDELRRMTPYLAVSAMKMVEDIIKTDLQYAERELGY